MTPTDQTGAIRRTTLPARQGHFMRYQTEIFISADRYVCLQLPDYLPEGRAVVTVFVEGPDDPGTGIGAGDDPDRHDHDHDIEWWEEFDGEETRRPS